MSEKFLFEVSWEVCNKVGGIYTVLKSKLEQAVNYWGENYILIGPLQRENADFIEFSTPFLERIKRAIAKRGFNCRVGYWDFTGKPKVILIDFKNRYDTSLLFYSLWESFGISSISADDFYRESVLFATAAGEIINTLSSDVLVRGEKVIAHFHEWLSGAGILYLKKNNPKVRTIFTTHATVMGRALSYNGELIYTIPKDFSVDIEAQKYNLLSKHLLEKASVHNADYFTTVSGITADEATVILKRAPDKIIWNGLDVEVIRKENFSMNIPEIRSRLISVASQVIKRKVAANALIWASSGRYEFHNKGYDILLKSLANLESRLPEDAPEIILFLLIAVNQHTKKDSLLDASYQDLLFEQEAVGISTHKLRDPQNDMIIKLCNELDFKKSKRKIHVIFSDAYLDGDDGVFNLPYNYIIASSDLTIFPSFYEPWGYTPLESLAYSVPTITTDLSGFGHWVDNNITFNHSRAVFVLKRKNLNEQQIVGELSDYLKLRTIDCDEHEIRESHKEALKVARLTDWNKFYIGYIEAYQDVIFKKP